MKWRKSQELIRRQLRESYDRQGVERYESWIAQIGQEDDEACVADLRPEFEFESGSNVLDAGAGTGAMSRVVLSAAEVQLTALEPCRAMVDVFRTKPELASVEIVEGFCDSFEDRDHFAEASFDVIVSRQLCNGMYDPIAAFENWRYWLRPGGTVVIVDGIYDRDAWGEETDVDALPLAACRTIATIPCILEATGFNIIAARWMTATNKLPSTRTPRYAVIAQKRC